MNWKFIGYSTLAAMIVMSSCKKDVIDDVPDEVIEFGAVTGHITSENGNRAIKNALVFVDDEGEIYHTYSDAQGNFNLDAPEGTHDLYIQTGNGKKFRTVTTVDIEKDATTSVNSGNSLKLAQVSNLAYISGTYDNIEAIIEDTLGYTATEITIADLANLNYITTFDAIFFNCGTGGIIDSVAYDNLSIYASNGGSLYASDWAIRFLMGGNVGAGSCPVVRPGGFIDDNTLCTDKSGNVGTIPSASIVATDIQNYLGTNVMEVEYDLGAWEMVQKY